MAQLHELIAVEPELKDKATKTRAELTKSLAHAPNFLGEVRTYQPLEESGESYPDEVTNITSSVMDVVNEFSDVYGNWMDVSIQKEITNTVTSADVVIDGKTLFESLPSTALLNLEARLAELKAFYSTLPVLDMTENWHKSDANDVWVSDPRITYKARKVLRNHVKAEATKEHPAQVDVYAEDVRIGEWTKVVMSSAITSKQKKEILFRIDGLLLAVKKARQRANTVEARTPDIADVVFSYIHGEVF